MVLGVTVLAEVSGKALLGNGLASQLRPRKYYTVSRETLNAMIGDVDELVNFFVIEAQRVLFAENVAASAAVSRHTILLHPLLYTLTRINIGCSWSFSVLLLGQDCSVLGPCLDWN